jgi:type IV secretory pathway VirJ component
MFGLTAALVVLAAVQTQGQACDSTRLSALPLIERPATADSGRVLVLLLTGDGGWAHSDEGVSRELLARGAAVVGMNMRSYLSKTKTPDILGQDVSCIAESYMRRWNRPDLMLLGYSRGADLAPFAASRLPSVLRQRLTIVALVSPSPWAGFTFHLIDLIRDVHRDDDLAVGPEIERLADLRLVCLYGQKDENSLCPRLSAGNVKVVELDGGHRITGGFAAMAEWLAEGLRPSTSRPPEPR